MRRPVLMTAAFILVAFILLQTGCGKKVAYRDLVDLLRDKAGTIGTLTFACITEDGEKVYREEFSFSFPDEYRYRFYDCADGEIRISRYAAQSGNKVVRARLMSSESGDSIQAEFLNDIPPIRNTGIYLSLYHILGNADYYYSLVSLLEGGSLEILPERALNGIAAYHLRSASGLKPETDLWLDAANGLPLRKEIVLSENRRIVFTYQDLTVNPPDPLEPFPESTREISYIFGKPDLPLELSNKDGGCRPADNAESSTLRGFAPLLPSLDGFEGTASYWRDPASSSLSPTEQSLQFPDGFSEFYLVLRSGKRQAEIREVPLVENFGYYTTGLGVLSEVYLVQQELLSSEEASASYTVALNWQELRLTAGGLEITVTGDLSRQEFENLARQFQSLAGADP